MYEKINEETPPDLRRLGELIIDSCIREGYHIDNVSNRPFSLGFTIDGLYLDLWGSDGVDEEEKPIITMLSNQFSLDSLQEDKRGYLVAEIGIIMDLIRLHFKLVNAKYQL